jgi:hypothetical protein
VPEVNDGIGHAHIAAFPESPAKHFAQLEQVSDHVIRVGNRGIAI